MEDWKEYNLGEVCENIYSGGTPSSMNASYWNGSLPWLSSGETAQRYIFSTEKYITKEGAENSSTRYAYKGSTVVASAGQGHTRGQASLLCIDTYVNQSVLVLRPNTKIIDSHYLYYNIDSRYNELRQLSDGTSTRGSLSGKILKDLNIYLPPLNEQKRIASILKSLDDKIECNRKINENLEQQAQALFKSWFVDFEPFKADELVESELGMIPKGWRVYSLSEFLPVITGKKDANVAKGGVYPFFSCSQDYSWTDEYSFDGSAILVAGNGDFNVKMYVGKFEAYQRTYVLIPYNPSYTAWLYYAVKYHLKEITSAARGSVIKFITKGNLADFKFAAPSSLDGVDIITKFDKIRKKVSAGIEESRRLAELRDTLLPKLMSGELNVENVTF